MGLGAVDLQLINALGINLHTEMQTKWHRDCWQILADKTSEPEDSVKQKQIKITNLLETCNQCHMLGRLEKRPEFNGAVNRHEEQPQNFTISTTKHIFLMETTL